VVDASVADVRPRVIFGFGVGGRLLASALRDIGQPYVVVELNAATVREVRRRASHLLRRREPPGHAGHGHIDRALAVVAMLSDPDASLRLAGSSAPRARVPIIVRTRYRAEAERLQQAGATLAVAEELEASLEVVPSSSRASTYPATSARCSWTASVAATSSRPLRAPTVPLGSAPREIREMPLATHQLEPRAWAVAARSRPSTCAPPRGPPSSRCARGAVQHPPPASLVLEAGDVVFLSARRATCGSRGAARDRSPLSSRARGAARTAGGGASWKWAGGVALAGRRDAGSPRSGRCGPRAARVARKLLACLASAAGRSTSPVPSTCARASTLRRFGIPPRPPRRDAPAARNDVERR